MRTGPWSPCCGRWGGTIEGHPPCLRQPPLLSSHSLVSCLRSFGRLALGAVLRPICPLCRQACDRPPGFCLSCRDRLELPQGGICGRHPLPWWAAGPYCGSLRSLLLRLKQQPRPDTLDALIQALNPPDNLRQLGAVLVPIPTWKRRGSRLPDVLSRRLQRQLGLRRLDLLLHHHPVLGQHHLHRQLRFANLDGAFVCRQPPRPGQGRRHPLLIVDDILTTGATACSAARTLKASGWQVAGVLCLARTGAGGNRR